MFVEWQSWIFRKQFSHRSIHRNHVWGKKSRNRPRWKECWLRPVMSGGHAAVSHLFICRCRPKNRVRFVLLQWVLKCRCRPVVCTFFGLELKWWGATDLKQVVRNLGSCLVCYSSCIVSRNTLGLVIAWTYFCPLYCCQSGLFYFPFFFSVLLASLSSFE